MSPEHRITSRSPTAEELQAMRAQTKPSMASWGCLLVIWGVVPMTMLAFTGGLIARWLAPDRVVMGRLLGAIAGSLILAWFMRLYIPHERRQRRIAAKDFDDLVVQEIAVRDPRVIEVGLINDHAPIVAMDIGDGKLLFLQGQWLIDLSIYGAPQMERKDDYEEFLNQLPAPYSFPSSAFTILRLPHSGMVLHIRVEGAYVRPEKEVEALRREFQFGDSELLEGELEQIADVLAKEHVRRVAAEQPEAQSSARDRQ
jgi:hypothetical protein